MSNTSNIKIITNILGVVETNCYFVLNQRTKEALIIDPAADADYIIGWCRKLQIKPKAVLLTHGHYDHTGAVGELKKRFNLPVYAGENEKSVLADPVKNGALLFQAEIPDSELIEMLNTDDNAVDMFSGANSDNSDNSETTRRGAKPVSVDRWLCDGEVIEPAGFPIKIIAAPGHTAGGICCYIEAEKTLFSGDVLFLDSFGRTDFPTGDQKTLAATIINKLFTLPDETKVYPGHGEPTTIKHEKANNPIYNYQ